MSVNLSQTIWKNRKVVVIENDYLRVIVIPSLGGKIASCFFKPRQFELAYQSTRPYEQPEYGDAFSQFDASGFDDLFPNVDAGHFEKNGRHYDFPDHGEVWSALFTCEFQRDAFSLSYRSQHLPYQYNKYISLNGSQLHITYKITHIGGNPFPCMWTFHGLMNYSAGMRLEYPNGTASFVNALHSKHLGEVGRRYELESSDYDFQSVPAPQDPMMVKYYVEGSVSDGRCAIEYPAHGVKIELSFPANTLPYLGFWITIGGYRGEYNAAFEPSTGYFDTIQRADKSKSLIWFSEGNEMKFDLGINLTNTVIHP